jgi:hypothetical protein
MPILVYTFGLRKKRYEIDDDALKLKPLILF